MRKLLLGAAFVLALPFTSANSDVIGDPLHGCSPTPLIV